jgi:hypothetical protein
VRVSVTPRPLFTPGKDPVFIVQEVRRGPEGSRKLRYYMTTAQDGGKVLSLKHRLTLSQEMRLVLISVRD